MFNLPLKDFARRIARIRDVCEGLTRIQEFEAAVYLNEYANQLDETLEAQTQASKCAQMCYWNPDRGDWSDWQDVSYEDYCKYKLREQLEPGNYRVRVFDGTHHFDPTLLPEVKNS